MAVSPLHGGVMGGWYQVVGLQQLSAARRYTAREIERVIIWQKYQCEKLKRKKGGEESPGATPYCRLSHVPSCRAKLSTPPADRWLAGTSHPRHHVALRELFLHIPFIVLIG